MKRIFGFVLVFAFCIGLMAASAFAGDESIINSDTVYVDGEGYINPTGNALRSQVATVIMRFCENVLDN